jgi:hypothetical protein
MANEAHVEINTGVNWFDGSDAKGEIGGAVGYDWSVLGGAFVGVEQSIDKTLVSNANVRWGTSGRVGTHVGPKDKLYATAGYNYGEGPDGADVGGGWEHSLGPVFTNVEYKHFFNEDWARDSNAMLVGAGLHF